MPELFGDVTGGCNDTVYCGCCTGERTTGDVTSMLIDLLVGVEPLLLLLPECGSGVVMPNVRNKCVLGGSDTDDD